MMSTRGGGREVRTMMMMRNESAKKVCLLRRPSSDSRLNSTLKVSETFMSRYGDLAPLAVLRKKERSFLWIHPVLLAFRTHGLSSLLSCRRLPRPSAPTAASPSSTAWCTRRWWTRSTGASSPTSSWCTTWRYVSESPIGGNRIDFSLLCTYFFSCLFHGICQPTGIFNGWRVPPSWLSLCLHPALKPFGPPCMTYAKFLEFPFHLCSQKIFFKKSKGIFKHILSLWTSFMEVSPSVILSYETW